MKITPADIDIIISSIGSELDRAEKIRRSHSEAVMGSVHIIIYIEQCTNLLKKFNIAKPGSNILVI